MARKMSARLDLVQGRRALDYQERSITSNFLVALMLVLSTSISISHAATADTTDRPAEGTIHG
jgi:hypothetical protein